MLLYATHLETKIEYGRNYGLLLVCTYIATKNKMYHKVHNKNTHIYNTSCT